MDRFNTNPQNQMDQRNFWDSLQMDILASSQKLSQEDYHSFVERSFMFSLSFRNCTPIEIKIFQQLFGLKKYAYTIMLQLTSPIGNDAITSIDEHTFFNTIKASLIDLTVTVGPLVNNRFCVLISHDSLRSDTLVKEESIPICNRLINIIKENFNYNVKVGVGSIQSFQSIYPSFVDALACLFYSNDNIVVYCDLNNKISNNSFDYLDTEKRLVEAIRLRKTEAYDYFGIILEWIKPMNDEFKRNKILELIVLSNFAMQLDSTKETKQTSYTSYVKQLMELEGNDLIELAYKCFMFITSYVKPQNTIDYSNHIVKATREYLENHYTDDISLEEMAAQVNISPQYFSKLIKKTTGFNFIDWLSMLRVKKAKELLNNTNLTVKEVCFMVGYKDPNYFSRIFKKRIGITPSEYVKTSSYLNNKS